MKKKRKSGARYCAICGRTLRKTPGPIGPTCLRKYCKGAYKKKRMSTSKHVKALKKMDIFREKEKDE